MQTVNLIFPHQLFEKSALVANGNPCYLIEEYLFFKQYNFHQQKIAYHRSTMRFYLDFLKEKGVEVRYIDAQDPLSDCRKLMNHLLDNGVTSIAYYAVEDNWLEKRLQVFTNKHLVLDSPMFINNSEDLLSFFKPGAKKYFQTSFYKQERVRLQLLIDADQNPVGGQWTYDIDNRKRYPKNKQAPKISAPSSTAYYQEAKSYVQDNFSENIGTLTDAPIYPINYEQTRLWLDDFLQHRFLEFGVYEDALVTKEHFLHHSVLTPMLNTGLLTPTALIDSVMAYADQHEIPINSLEGFIRQIIGWREFLRGVYRASGTQQRTTNFWKFSRKIPASFYDGSTGIAPVDTVIKKLLKTGYSHHIERLMVLGNIMVLCEFDPDDVYQWFMELYIDAYDWVMVPNVYGMSQFSDGGLMATKPYISGSNYLTKMGDFPKGEWELVWDALFWRFLDKHRTFFLKNPRLSMLVKSFDKWDQQKKDTYLSKAEDFLFNIKS